MELINLSNYIICDVFNFLKLNELIRMRQVNSLFKQIIKNGYWNHFVIIKNEQILNYVVHKFKFFKFRLYEKITDKNIKLLSNCHTFDFSCCTKITDESVKFLGNCHTLNLFCCNITNKSVKFLKNVITLHL